MSKQAKETKSCLKHYIELSPFKLTSLDKNNSGPSPIDNDNLIVHQKNLIEILQSLDKLKTQ